MAKRVLVIDDEELVIGSLKKLLKKNDYDVEIAKSGVEAMEKIEKADFDLIVSDIRMPEVDGIEIIKKIREYLKKNGKQCVPEILITGYASKEKYQAAVDLGVRNYINKPFDINELLEAVKEALNEG